MPPSRDAMIFGSVISPLVYLLLPLVLAVAVLASPRGPLVARVVVAAFALATLSLGTGSLALDELRGWALAGASEGLFVSLSTGIVVGGIGWWPPRAWRRWVAGVPLAAVLLGVVLPAIQWPALALGVVLGALPLLVASALPRQAPPATRSPETALDRSAWIVMGLTVMLALTAHRTVPAVLATLGQPAPLPGGVERLVGGAILVLAVAMVSPWPLHRIGTGVVLTPAAAILVHQMAGSIAPLGIAGWLPLAAMVLVPSALIAAWRGHWSNALGSIALLAAPWPGWPGACAVLFGATAAVVVVWASHRNPGHPHRISFPEAPVAALLVAVALALAVAAVLSREVVLGTLLAGGVATVAARRAPRPSSD